MPLTFGAYGGKGLTASDHVGGHGRTRLVPMHCCWERPG